MDIRRSDIFIFVLFKWVASLGDDVLEMHSYAFFKLISVIYSRYFINIILLRNVICGSRGGENFYVTLLRCN